MLTSRGDLPAPWQAHIAKAQTKALSVPIKGSTACRVNDVPILIQGNQRSNMYD
jgi:hypothetical protein